MSKTRSYFPYLDTSVQNLKLMSKIWLLNVSVQVWTLDPQILLYHLLPSAYFCSPERVLHQPYRTLLHWYAFILQLHTAQNEYEASESPWQIFCSFVFINFCPFSKALVELCHLLRVKRWHSMWRKASESLTVVRSSLQVKRLLHLNHLVMWWMEAGMIAYLNHSERAF